ncbi:MAG: response regulator [Treponemataceae bacterium]
MKILIVDDNRDDRTVLKYLIERKGHEVIEAENGEDGLQKIKDDPPNLIISDALMPTMDGFQFLRAIKKEKDLCSIPFVFYSASYQQNQDVRLASALGADAYILKPEDPVELWKKIDNILTAKKRKLVQPSKLVKEDAEYLKCYSEVLAVKLEDKVQKLNSSLAEKEHAETALRRLNRELRAISNCNQALMHADDEQKLLAEICRIICEEAGYRMAWVGYAERDAAKTIRPVATSGAESGYLADARISWADTERGRGASGMAIRGGKSHCIQDFLVDSFAAPWREMALRRGYRSSIALPLKDEKTDTFGVLNIYSAEPNAFTADEVRLLEELSGDLAYGITTLRARKERDRAENELRMNERRLRSFFDDSPISIWEEDFSGAKRLFEKARSEGVRDWEGFFASRERVMEFASQVQVLDVNRATLKLLERDDKSTILGSILKIFDEEGYDSFRSELIALASGHLSYEDETIRHTVSGKRVFVQRRLRIVPGYEESWSRVLVSLVDLSERRKAERALQESEAKYRGLVEQSAEGIILLDATGTVLECNPVLECLIGANKGQIIGRKIWDFEFKLLPEGFATEGDFESLKGQWEIALENCEEIAQAGPYEAVIKQEEGNRRKIIEQTFFPISSATGLMIGGIMRDVTENREAAESLMSSLREKELLLQEVNHRVKNNLQIICSLVNLQLLNSNVSSETGIILRDIDARVRSMSLVHELLYQSDDFAFIEFSTYARQLCNYLLEAYAADPRRVRVDIAIDEIPLSIDKAIPCGLIINELVVNSLKHAFPAGRRGTVTIEMDKDANGRVRLTVRDDGVGMVLRESEKRSKKSIGLMLVENLTEQLNGECLTESDAGVRTSIFFPS